MFSLNFQAYIAMQLNNNFTPFPQLQTQRLVLRKPLHTDAAKLHELRSNTTVLQYLNRAKPSSINETAEFVKKLITITASGDGITWIITQKHDSELIGTINFWPIDLQNFRAEVGYMLSPQHQKQGFMNEALMSVINYGFNQMNLHSIEANCNAENIASIQLLEKCNFVKEAHFKENYYYDGKFSDSVIYSLVNKL